MLNTKLEGGTAGDLITCRPFDASLALFDKGYLAPLNDLPGMANFSDVAKSAWITDDGKNVFCVPMASVIHGFFYNKDAFADAGIDKEPDDSGRVLRRSARRSKTEGTYTPMAMGTSDLWEAATMGFQNIGPNYWKGEEGRKALIAGTGKYTDQPYVDTWAQLAKWAPYHARRLRSGEVPRLRRCLFTSGQAAIYPTGSWEISSIREGCQLRDGHLQAAAACMAGDTCYISDHTDIALGMNAATKHPEEAKIFLDWVASQEFAELYSNALPGFFSLSNAVDHPDRPAGPGIHELARPVRRDHPQLVPDPLAWRAEPGERAVAGQRRRDQRHADPRAGRHRKSRPAWISGTNPAQ